MKPLIKVMLTLGSIFALTFILGRLLGILTVENVKHWLEMAGNVDPLWLTSTIVFLLFLDLFVAVPTLTITLLAGSSWASRQVQQLRLLACLQRHSQVMELVEFGVSDQSLFWSESLRIARRCQKRFSGMDRL